MAEQLAGLGGKMGYSSLVAIRKNPHAVALGRSGGQKGGKARAEELRAAEIREISSGAGKARMEGLSERERKELARKAAAARWAGHEALPPAIKGKKPALKTSG